MPRTSAPRRLASSLAALPLDLLRRIGDVAASPALVVAFGRTRELREDLDAAERARAEAVGWRAYTVKEAERRLRDVYGYGNNVLGSRDAAGDRMSALIGDMFREAGAVDSALETIQLLIAYGARPDVIGSYGATPLHNLFKYRRNLGGRAISIARSLLMAGADVNARIPSTDDIGGRSPLSWALTTADEDDDDSDDDDAYHTEKFRHIYSMARLYIKHGADVVQAERDYLSNIGRTMHPGRDGFLRLLRRRSTTHFTFSRTLHTDDDLDALISELEQLLSTALGRTDSDISDTEWEPDSPDY